MAIRHVAALGAAFLVGISGYAGAQGGGGGGGGGRGMNLERMREQLSLAPLLKDVTLTEAQQKSVTTIEAKYAKLFEPMFEEMRVQISKDGPPDREAMRARREKMGKISSAEYDEVRAVLTAEQKTVFNKNIEDREAARQQRRPGE